MILTSETIYSAENYQCLHDTIKALLKLQGTTYPLNNSAEGPQKSIVGLRTEKVLVFQNQHISWILVLT